MKISVDITGSFQNLERYLTKDITNSAIKQIDGIVNDMTSELIAKTPKDSGLTAGSWKKVKMVTKSGYEVSIINSNGDVVRWLTYGHLTGTGGWVRPNKFVLNVTKSGFTKIDNKIKEVLK